MKTINGIEVGSQPPGYMFWHEWAEAQSRGGLQQLKCPKCQLWKFPQEIHCAAGSNHVD